jgi:ATP-dependent Clp protease ATP-binding subunit ClpC
VFERFSDDARQVIRYAQEESKQFGHDSVGVEHLLLGVARTDPALVRVSADDVRAQVAERLGMGTQRVEGNVPFSAGAKGALERSLTAALQRGDRQIAPEHLLMALLVDERAAAVLRACGEPPRDAGSN